MTNSARVEKGAGVALKCSNLLKERSINIALILEIDTNRELRRLGNARLISEASVGFLLQFTICGVILRH